MNSRSLAVVAPMLFALSITADAAGLAINPGLWETTMTRSNSLTGEETTETTTRCVKETEFDPSDMVQNGQGCELVENNLDGDMLTFRMECNMQGSEAAVDGMFQTDGQTGMGKMDMTMGMGEIKMTMNMNWTSTRLGDC